MKLCQMTRVYGNFSAVQKCFLSFITAVPFFPHLESSPRLVGGNNEGMSR